MSSNDSKLSERELLRNELIESWRKSPFEYKDENNNVNNFSDPELIFMSTNYLDYNYKSKRAKIADNKNPKFKLREVQRPAPVKLAWEFMSSILELTDFKFTSQLGRGSFGVVFETEVVEGQVSRKLAVKVIQTSKDCANSQQLQNSYLAELNIKNLKHPNLIYQLGSNPCDSLTNNAFIIYEFGGKYNLNQFLHDPDCIMNIQRRRSFSIDLTRALEFIHSNNIVHMDLKPANVIVTDNFVCKLTDFGCSVKLNKKYNNLINNDQALLSEPFEDNRWTAGTWFYRAPELFRKDKQINVTTKCDIYSLGIVMWQLLTRESPYHEEHEDPHVIIYQIVTRKLRPKFPSNFLSNVPKLNSSKSLSKSYIARSTSPSSLSNSTTSLVSSTSSLSLSSASSNEQISDRKSNYSESSSLWEIRNFLNNKAKTVPSLFKTSSSNDINQRFEHIYRCLIEKLWSDDHTKRFDAKQLKETLLNTKITY